MMIDIDHFKNVNDSHDHLFGSRVLKRLGEHLSIVTPSEPSQRGCQLSIRLRQGRDLGQEIYRTLLAQGVICDWREPDILRASPAPLYNSYSDCDGLVAALAAELEKAR